MGSRVGIKELKKVKCAPYYFLLLLKYKILFNMAQKPPQFQRPLLRTGSIAFLAGILFIDYASP